MQMVINWRAVSQLRENKVRVTSVLHRVPCMVPFSCSGSAYPSDPCTVGVMRGVPCHLCSALCATCMGFCIGLPFSLCGAAVPCTVRLLFA